uniref:Major facilitator superfamily (MFS) profile domain-containing protein n=1 Tax=Kwoniella dejecticola CBS 10117 TaxID=1296121 RepID=A0A1A5ZTN4_9TREE|nr:uncharacterized protein I303_08563 [Kwoniella dejecticola CBS 10117]OBR81178.1 hypothetical protein I303_08563 [Kwoniella dejecticola CBS 10117]
MTSNYLEPDREQAETSPTSFGSRTRIVNTKASEEMGGGDSQEVDRQVKLEDYSFYGSTKFGICFLALCLNVMIFGLDQFIITVAVPEIVTRFDSLDQVEWLNTAFFIPCAGCILIFSQIMTIASPRWTYLVSLAIFEAGTAICGAANSMFMLIIGRAIAGLGGAGMWNATYLIGGEIIPFEKRPSLFGLFGISFIVASVMGPLVGGAFTDMGPMGWRWCFYFSASLTGILLLLTLPSIPKLPSFDGKPDNRSVFVKLIRLDWISAIITLGFVTSLGVGLQNGGIRYEWNDTSVIVVSILREFYHQGYLGLTDYGRRAGTWVAFLGKLSFAISVIQLTFPIGYGVVVLYLYYLPLYFEAVKNDSATRAGVLLLALQLTMGPFLVFSGKLGEKTGQAKYPMIIGSCLLAISSGLFTMLKKDTSVAMVVGFMVIGGVGLGLVMNVMVVLVQAKYLKEPHLIPHVTNVFNFWGFVGRIVSMSVGTNIFNNKLRSSLYSLPNLSRGLVISITTGLKSIWTQVPDKDLTSVLEAYSSSLTKVFWLALALSISCLIATLLMENINLKNVAEDAKKVREANLDSQQSYAMQAQGEGRQKGDNNEA